MRGIVLRIDVYKLLDLMNDLQANRACMNLSFPRSSQNSKSCDLVCILNALIPC